ncbi:CHAT domain-containing protein [Nocardioides sp. 1609]|uniref:CHAT domain-containing protein n=1 Tax=Nocardioides sp. 1609 TaxID=2508327 RepID=UPI001ADA4312|nr:CHAT domain-containing protein [Nocardioides sp. 1609]
MDRKRKQRIDAEKKASNYRIKESIKRTEATKARGAAMRASNASTARSKANEAERKERDAASAGKEANSWSTRATGYLRDEVSLQTKVAKAEQTEAAAADRKRAQDLKKAERKTLADRSALDSRISQTEFHVDQIARQIPSPKPEKLRVLILGASADGGLRVGREQKRIRAAVESALHRDQIELDVRPAATPQDLLDGVTKFRPHVVHFSGHSNENLIEFEDEVDEPHDGVVVTARAFANAVRATDTPPLLIMLNSCSSAGQIDDLVADVSPFAIGMADTIDDGDAISYAAQFYAAVANGQSVLSAHHSGRAALELAGLDGAELPALACTDGVDPAQAVLVTPS